MLALRIKVRGAVKVHWVKNDIALREGLNDAKAEAAGAQAEAQPEVKKEQP